jgi:hypothetical protein
MKESEFIKLNFKFEILNFFGVHFIKHHIQGCIFKMCRNVTYEVVGQRRKLKAIKKNCSSKNKCRFIF